MRTERLVLEPMAEDLAEGLWKASQESIEDLRPWLPWTRDERLESTFEFAEQAVQQWEAGQGHHFVILEGGEIVGGVGLSVDALFGNAEIGYWLRSDRTGHGLATEAVGAVVTVAFEELGLERIELRAGVENVRSRRLAERLGFRLEGTLRSAGVGARDRYDCCMYALLRTDPRP